MKTKADQAREALSVLQDEQPGLRMRGLGLLLQPCICGNKPRWALPVSLHSLLSTLVSELLGR